MTPFYWRKLSLSLLSFLLEPHSTMELWLALPARFGRFFTSHVVDTEVSCPGSEAQCVLDSVPHRSKKGLFNSFSVSSTGEIGDSTIQSLTMWPCASQNLLQNFKTRGIAKSWFSCYKVLIMLLRTKAGNQCCPPGNAPSSFPCPSASPDFHEWILDAKRWQTIVTFQSHKSSGPWPRGGSPTKVFDCLAGSSTEGPSPAPVPSPPAPTPATWLQLAAFVTIPKQPIIERWCLRQT